MGILNYHTVTHADIDDFDLSLRSGKLRGPLRCQLYVYRWQSTLIDTDEVFQSLLHLGGAKQVRMLKNKFHPSL